MKVKAVIFDMDGVIVDSEVHWRGVESEFLRVLIPSWSERDQQNIIGMSAHDVYQRLVEEHQLKINKVEYFGFYQQIAKQIYGEQANLFEGCRNLMQHLANLNLRLALASSSPHAWIDIVLDRFKLREFFQVVTSADDVGGRGKPAPDIYLKTAERLNLAPAGCLAIEDTNKGVESASNAGMLCLGYRNGFNAEQDFSRVLAEIDSFDLPQILKFLE